MAQLIRKNDDGVLQEILQTKDSNHMINHLQRFRSSEMLFGMKHFESDIISVESNELALETTCINGGNRGILYRILCTDTTIPGEPQWSVWKTAKEFAELDRAIRSTYPNLLKQTPFPSKSLPNLLAAFIGLEGLLVGIDPVFYGKLKKYWRQVMSEPSLTDFDNNNCSVLIKNFVEIDTNVEEFLDNNAVANSMVYEYYLDSAQQKVEAEDNSCAQDGHDKGFADYGYYASKKLSLEDFADENSS